MMSRLWLSGAAIFVAALLVTAVVVALVTTRGGVDMLPADSPEGVVQRYLLALEDGEYQEAYDYLSGELQDSCSLSEFLRRAPSSRTSSRHTTLEKTDILGDSAMVTARVTTFEPDIPFGASEYSYNRTFQLMLEDGDWRLTTADWLWCPPPY